MKKIFISYSHSDGEAIAEFLHERLTDCGYNVWKDNHDLPLGTNFPRAISDALQETSDFLVLLTKASLQSDWVGNEIDMAMTAGSRVLPILLDGVLNEDIPLYLRKINYLPIQGVHDWQGLHKLVNGLEGGSKIPRIYSMSNRDDTKFEGVLLLGKSEVTTPNLQDPKDVMAKAEKLWRDFLPYWNKIKDVGLVPPGHAAVANAVLAHLAGKPNQLPHLFYPYPGPDGKFRVSADVCIDLQSLRVFAQSQ